MTWLEATGVGALLAGIGWVLVLIMKEIVKQAIRETWPWHVKWDDEKIGIINKRKDK